MLEANPGMTLHDAVRATQRVRILVADDDPDMRQWIARPLRNDGYQVVELQDGGELLECLGGLSASARRYVTPPDVIILDLCMPTKSGMEILAAFRATHWTVPIIVITALDEEDIDRSALEGTAGVLHKPFDLKRLRSMVQAVVTSGADGFHRSRNSATAPPRGGQQ